MKYLIDGTALAGDSCPPDLLFPHVVHADPGQVPGMTAAVGKLFTDAEVDRGTPIRLRVFRSTPQGGPGPLVATAALFALDERLFVVDVIPAAADLASCRTPAAFTPAAYRVVANAIVDFSCDEGLPLVYFPTAACLTPAESVPYDAVEAWYGAKLRKTIGSHRHWRVLPDGAPIARLLAGSVPRRHDRSICLVHTFADQSGDGGGSGDLRRVASTVIDLAARHDASVTFCVPGRLYREVSPMLGGQSTHAIAFRGDTGPGGLLRELPTLQAIAREVHGYCPPEKAPLPDFVDRTLSHFGFGWLLQGPCDARAPVTVHRHGVVRLSVSLDDTTLPGRGLGEWLSDATAAASRAPVCVLELSGARSNDWLPGYDRVVRALAERGALRSCEEVVADALADVRGLRGVA
jgi:hypothetical protein